MLIAVLPAELFTAHGLVVITWDFISILLRQLLNVHQIPAYRLYCITNYYITLHYKLFIVAKVKICKVHYGTSHTTMSGYDCQNKCVFSFRWNDNNDVAVVISRGRVFQILGPAVANEWSPTVTRRDGRTSRNYIRLISGLWLNSVTVTRHVPDWSYWHGLGSSPWVCE